MVAAGGRIGHGKSNTHAAGVAAAIAKPSPLDDLTEVVRRRHPPIQAAVGDAVAVSLAVEASARWRPTGD